MSSALTYATARVWVQTAHESEGYALEKAHRGVYLSAWHEAAHARHSMEMAAVYALVWLLGGSDV
jgi:hypothetical protein